MATDPQTATDGEQAFGTVSRTKGLVFEYCSLAASVVGLVALGVLLIYVAVDAFDLQNASPQWLATYLAAAVGPYVAFCLYSVGDRDVTQRATIALFGGAGATFAAVQAIERLVGAIPRIEWHVAYLFLVVVPTVGYLTYLATREPVGAVGFGLVGRLLGGLGLGLATVVLFDVFDANLLFLAYTIGVLPATAVLLYSRRRPSSPASLLTAPVAIAGIVLAGQLHAVLDVYPTTWLLYVWTVALPVAGGLTAVTATEYGRERGLRLAALALAVALGGSLAVGAVDGSLLAGTVAGSVLGGLLDVGSGSALLVLLTTTVPTVAFVHRVVDRTDVRVGLLLPVLLVGGVALGALTVRLNGFPGPDPWLDPSYVTEAPSRTAAEAGLYPAIVGSVLIIALVAGLSFVFGVGTAVFLEEYTPESGLRGAAARLIQINVANLAAVPSVVYGLLGLGLFAGLLGLGFGTVVTAAATLSLLILPITIVSAQEAIRGVPEDLRRGSDAMGATRWQTTKRVVLPEAMPGILTGTILALGRAIGETAPLIMIGASTTVFSAPEGIWSRTSAMPLQIFAWANYPQAEFRYGVVAAGVVALLIVLLGMNATAIVLRNRSEGGV